MIRPVLLLLLSAMALNVHAQRTIQPEFTAKVIHVDDGDTVVVLDEQNQKTKVRLANIDAPETSHGRCRPGQPWSAQSTDFLGRAIKGRQVKLLCSTLDRYGRSVCDILIDGTTANRMLTSAGLAWANRSNPSYLRDPGVAQAELEARSARKGLWNDRQSIPPWEWRKTAWGAAPGCNN